MATDKARYLGVAFGPDDDDLVEWKNTCMLVYGENSSRFTRTALRNEIARRKESREDPLSLSGVVRLLKEQTAKLDAVCSALKNGTIGTNVTSTTPRTSADAAGTVDFESAAKSVGWGVITS